MFVSHPDTVCVVQQVDHVERVAAAVAARRAAGARRISTDRLAGAASIRRHVGSAMVAIGRRLQGVKPIGLSAPAVARSDVASENRRGWLSMTAAGVKPRPVASLNTRKPLHFPSRDRARIQLAEPVHDDRQVAVEVAQVGGSDAGLLPAFLAVATIPAGAGTEDEADTGDAVEGAGRVGSQVGVAVAVGSDEMSSGRVLDPGDPPEVS